MFALLVLDVQVGLVRGPEPMWRCTEVLDTINTLMAQARRAGAPIFLARHIGPVGTPIGPGSPLTQLAPELQLDGSEVVFEKHRPSAFAGTDLLQQLQARNVTGLVITGMKTQYCVDTNCRVARDLGLDAVLIADGHTCADTPSLQRRRLWNTTTRRWQGRFARSCPQTPGISRHRFTPDLRSPPILRHTRAIAAPFVFQTTGPWANADGLVLPCADSLTCACPTRACLGGTHA